MKGRNQNALLMEIMIAVLFFAICSTVLLNVFSGVHEYSAGAQATTDAMIAMKDLSARLYACENAEETLAAEGFSLRDDTWEKDAGKFAVEVDIDYENTAAGHVRNAVIRAMIRDKNAGEIPCARYFPGEAMG